MSGSSLVGVFVDVVGCVLFLENTIELTRSRPSAVPAITYNTVADIDSSALCCRSKTITKDFVALFVWFT